MASIRNPTLTLLEKRPDGSATLRITFTIRQNSIERDFAPNLSWDIQILFYGVDGDGDHLINRLWGMSRTNPSALQDIPQQKDFPFAPGLLDEDPWWGLGDTMDEIRARITIYPVLASVSGDGKFTNMIREFL